jgi:hypothetical protein
MCVADDTIIAKPTSLPCALQLNRELCGPLLHPMQVNKETSERHKNGGKPTDLLKDWLPRMHKKGAEGERDA